MGRGRDREDAGMRPRLRAPVRASGWGACWLAGLREVLDVAARRGQRASIDADGGEAVRRGRCREPGRAVRLPRARGGSCPQYAAAASSGPSAVASPLLCPNGSGRSSSVAVRPGSRLSRELAQSGVEHVVLERGRVGGDLAGALGQLLPCDPQLERAATPATPMTDRIPTASCPATSSCATSSTTRRRSTRRCARASRSAQSHRSLAEALRSPPRPGTSWPPPWSCAPAHTSGPTGRQEPPRSRPTCSRSTWRIIGTRGSCRRARFSSSEAASPDARSPRSFTRPAAASS